MLPPASALGRYTLMLAAAVAGLRGAAPPVPDTRIDYARPVENLAHDPDAANPSNPRNLLTGRFDAAWLGKHLSDPNRWLPYPTIGHRAEWDGVAADVRTSILQSAERDRTKGWETLTATMALSYLRSGNRSDYGRIFSERQTRLQDLVLAELLEDKGRYLDAITDAVWLISEETFWGQPVHLPQLQRSGPGLPNVAEPTIELFAAERGAALAWTYHLLENRLDAVSPFVRERIAREIDRRILTPFLARDDFWWMGLAERKDLNNWTPWIVSNVLTCALLMEKDPARRAALVEKCLQVLDRYLNRYPADGGCDEGPGYWQQAAGSTFECLDLLRQATGGALDIFHEPLIRNLGHFICDSHVAGPWTLNFSDNSARAEPNAMLLFRFGQKTGDAALQAFGAWRARQERPESAARGSLLRVLPSLFQRAALLAAPAAEPLPRDIYLPDLQLAAARETAGSTRGLYFALRGYYNAKSHNHNDVGSFMLYADGFPVLIDPGVEAYTTQSFSPERYAIWTMQSAYHNLPTINGQMQPHGRRYAARDVSYRADDRTAVMSLDLAKAYPPEAAVETWRREIAFVRGRAITLAETYRLSAVRAPLILNLMTAGAADSGARGRLVLTSGTADEPGPQVAVTYDADRLRPRVETIKLSDRNLQGVWGDSIRRIQLIADHPGLAGTFWLEFRKI